MMQVQFFLFGLLLVWFIGTGKLAALFAALATTPVPSGSPSAPDVQPNPANPLTPPNVNPPSNPSAGIFPCPDDPNAPCIDNPADPSHPLHLMI
jgi:hypothetical protein